MAIFRLLALLLAVRRAAGAFSLDTSGTYWAYTSSDLADTASQACKDAYSASIDCDETLLGLVASMSPSFNPQASDLESMCTSTCSGSLAQYVEKVKAACNQPGDLANVASGNQGIPQAPVAVVGEVFQYKYGEACAMDGTNYCYLTYPESSDWAETKFPCSDTCAVQFFQNAHDQPGSAYEFDYFYLGNQTSYWEGVFAGGWDTVVQCGDAVSGSSSMSMGMTATVTATVTATPTNVSPSMSIISSTMGSGSPTVIVAAAETTGTRTATSALGTATATHSNATSTVATSGAGRSIRLPFARWFF